MKCIKVVLQILACVYYVPIDLAYAAMICHQDNLGETETLHCPQFNAFDPDLGYCCTNNGRVSCCSYDDYYQRHFGPSTGTVIAVIVSHTLMIIFIVYWCRRNTQSPEKEIV